jgi:hypothetical protein
LSDKPIQVTVRAFDHGRGFVRINGRDIPNVVGITLRMSAGGLNTVLIELVPGTLSFDGPALPSIGEQAPPEAKPPAPIPAPALPGDENLE